MHLWCAMNKFTLPLCLGALVVGAPSAHAATCDSLSLDDYPQEVIIGQWGVVQSTPVVGAWIPPTGELGVCWRDVGGDWHLEQLDCDTSDGAGDVFKLYTRGGDDYVSVLRPEHTLGLVGDEFTPAGAIVGGTIHGLECEWGAIAPWSSSFDFGLEVRLGTGADEVHGSPNDDYLASNNAFAGWVRNNALGGPAWLYIEEADPDGAIDMLCGGPGNDELYGDLDDSWSAGAEEWLDGGAGFDICDGDPFDLDGLGSVSDVIKTTCEDREDGWVNNGYFSCETTENPVWAVYLPWE